MGKHKDDCKCLDCNKINFEDARHFNQIGWSITSFFLIFLGTILDKIIEWQTNLNSTNKYFWALIIILVMFFGFIVARLFLRSQWRKMKIYGKENKFWSNCSVRLYVSFILLIEIILFIILLESILSLIILIPITLIFMLLFLLVLVLDIRKLKRYEKS